MTVLVDRTELEAFTADAQGDLEWLRLLVGEAGAALATMGSNTDPALVNPARQALDDAAEVLARLDRLVEWPAHLAAAFGRLDDRFTIDRRLGDLLEALHSPVADPTRLGRLVAALGQLPPAAVARAWEELSPARRRWLERLHPELVVSLDGVPPEVRDRLNRVAIETAIADLRAQLADDGPDGLRLTGDAEWDPVPGHTALHARLARFERLLDADRILVFDPRGDGRAVVAMGDPATARHVATIVPGIGTTLDATGRLMHNAETLRAESQAIDDDVATIAWLGYDAPPGPFEIGAGLVGHDWDPGLQAGTRITAEAEQQLLVDHAAGIRAINPGVHHTVVAHSYGSVLAFQALQPGGTDTPLDVDDVVALGSPGPGADIDELGDLDLPDHVGIWSARGFLDPVPLLLPVLGRDVEDLGDIVTELPMDWSNRGHVRYFTAGSAGLAATAAVVAARPRRIPTRPEDDKDRAER